LIALKIIGIIVLIIAAIMLIPLGVDFSNEGGEISLAAKVCGFRIKILPKDPNKAEKPPKKKREKKPKKTKKDTADAASAKDAGQKQGKKKFKMPLDLNLDEILSLVKKVLGSLGRFGRKIRVDRFKLHLLMAGKDPYGTAMSFGYVNSALCTLAPVCRRVFKAKDVDVLTDVDFTREDMLVDAGLAIHIIVGDIFNMIFSVLFGALAILIKNRIRVFKRKRAEKKEKINKNIDVQERTVSNGQ